MIKVELYILVLVFALFSSGAPAQVSEVERQALIDLYEATDGDNWHRNEGWLEHPDVCEWEGITCRVIDEQQVVTSLHLNQNGLRGEIPPSITELLHLGSLRLNRNWLEGELADFLIDDLPNLQRLDLSYNRLSGPLPDVTSSEDKSGILRSAVLDLSHNRLSGELPTSWSRLTWGTVDLGSNQVTGPIPEEWASSKIYTLRLSDNQFEGELFAVLADMPNLEILDLSDNDFSGPLPEWLAGLELIGLYLQGNQLSGSIDYAVQAMVNGEYVELMLADNRFSGPIPATLLDLDFWSFAPIFGIAESRLPGLDLCWNQFDLPDDPLLRFLGTHQEGGNILNCLEQSRIDLDPTISGTWFEPERAGEGFAQQLLHDGRMFVYWFSYSPRLDETGSQFWGFGAVKTDENNARFEPVYAPTGGRFSQGLGNRSVEFDPLNAGRLFIDRVGDGKQQARYSQLGQARCSGSLCGTHFATTDSGTFDQVQLTRLAGTACDNQQPHQETSALWFSPHSNEGFVVEVIEDGRGVVYWFTYEPNDSGRQAWMTGVGEFHGDTLQIDDLVQPVGGHFGREFDPDEIEYLHWGSLTLEFDDFWNGQAQWNSALPDYGQGSYPLRRLTIPKLAECE